MVSIQIFLIVVATFLGLAIGSFLNVVIWRVPRHESIVFPTSHCPKCGATIAWYDNLPLLSWLLLRRRCRACQAPISIRYPLIELTTALMFGGITWVVLSQLGSAVTNPTELVGATLITVGLLGFAACSIALTAIDIDTLRLPNSLVWTSTAFALLAAGGVAVWQQNLLALVGSVLGGVMATAFFLATKLVMPAGLGWGDVKLAFPLGVLCASVGWGALIVGFLAAFFLGTIWGVSLLLLKRATRSTKVPFGPWLILGCWIGVSVGQPLWTAYLSNFGVTA